MFTFDSVLNKINLKVYEITVEANEILFIL